MKEIKAARIMKNLTQRELSEKIEEPLFKIRKIEQGIMKPNIDILLKIADVLDITLDELVGR